MEKDKRDVRSMRSKKSAKSAKSEKSVTSGKLTAASTTSRKETSASESTTPRKLSSNSGYVTLPNPNPNAERENSKMSNNTNESPATTSFTNLIMAPSKTKQIAIRPQSIVHQYEKKSAPSPQKQSKQFFPSKKGFIKRFRKGDSLKSMHKESGHDHAKQNEHKKSTSKRTPTKTKTKPFNKMQALQAQRELMSPEEIAKQEQEEQIRLEKTVTKGRKLAEETYVPFSYTIRAIRSLLPLRMTMWLFCRTPLTLKLNDFGVHEFNYNWKNPRAIVFLILSSLMGLHAILMGINYFSVMSNFPKMYGSADDYFKGPRCNDDPKYQQIAGLTTTPAPAGAPPFAYPSRLSTEVLRAEEWYLIKRNIIPFVIAFTCAIQSAFASYWFYKRRHLICLYMNFLTQSADTMKMNYAYGLGKFMWTFSGVWFVFLLILTIFGALNFAPITGGLCTTVVTMTFRVFYPKIHAINHTSFTILRKIAGLWFLIVFVASKVYIFMFMWCCRVIKNGFIVWNYRLDSVLLRGEKQKTHLEKIVHRTEFLTMFSDHVTLLDLIQGVDKVFGGTVEVYYLTQVISTTLELFFILRSYTSDVEFNSVRQNDGGVMFVFVVQSCIVLYLVTRSAADINDEALEGLEVIRRRGYMGKKTDAELYFLQSMYISYTGHFDISVMGAKYVVMDRTFLLMIINTIGTFMVIALNISPQLTLRDPTQLQILVNNSRISAKYKAQPWSPILWQTEHTWIPGHSQNPCGFFATIN